MLFSANNDRFFIRVLSVFVVSDLLSLSSVGVDGCSVAFPPPTLEDHFNWADGVYAATVVSVSPSENINANTNFTVRVDDAVWKGGATPNEVQELITCGNSACCGITSFLRGDRWILFHKNGRVTSAGGSQKYDENLATKLDALVEETVVLGEEVETGDGDPASECPNGDNTTLEDNFNGADAVYAATVLSVSPNENGTGNTNVTVEVSDEVWKGGAIPNEIIELVTCGNSACCGITAFIPGDRWILFPRNGRVSLDDGSQKYGDSLATQIDDLIEGTILFIEQTKTRDSEPGDSNCRSGDDPLFLTKGGVWKNKSCEWVAKQPERRCRTRGLNGTRACVACCKTCADVGCRRKYPARRRM